jgi:ribosome-binding factor A
MTARRLAKMSEAIREVVSMAILTEVKDPRVRDVTVTHVEVAPDMRSATVHVSVMGDDKQQRLCLYGLESSTGYLQRKVGDRVQTRYTPKLHFELDLGVKKSIEIARILREVLPSEAPPRPSDAEGFEDDDLTENETDDSTDELALGEDDSDDDGSDVDNSDEDRGDGKPSAVP